MILLTLLNIHNVLTIFLLTVVNYERKYVAKELKSDTIGVYQTVDIGPYPSLCAMMCSNLFETKQGYGFEINSCLIIFL